MLRYAVIDILVCFCALLNLNHCYSTDSLGNSSLKLVPAALGSDVELRCFKVLQALKGSYRYPYTKDAICTGPYYGCGHMWSKSGTILGMAGNTSTSKFEFSAQTSYGYCAAFTDTKQNVDSLTGSFNQTAMTSGEYRFKCLVSILSIKNVTLDDLGVYTCNFTTHYDAFYRYENGPEIDFVEVALPGTKAPAKEIIFATLAYQGTNEELLVQCISTGGKIKWIMFPNTDSYRYSCNDDNYDWCKAPQTPLDDFDTYDHWRSYNYSVFDSSPFEDVFESILAVQGISGLDFDKIACIVEGTTNGKLISMLDTRPSFYFYDDYSIPIVLTPLLLVLLLIGFFILAAVRAKVCCQDDRRFVSIAVSQPQVAPQV